MKTAGVVGEPRLGLRKVEARDRSQDSQDPGDTSGDDTKGGGTNPQGRWDAAKQHGPVNGQQHDEEDFTVQAHEEQPREQLAHGIAENPEILHLVVDPEGQCEQEDEVRNGQVEEVDVRYLSEPPVYHEDQEY